MSARTTVRVRLTIELDASGSWGEDATVSQVRRQGIDAVEMALRRGLVINGLTCEGQTKTRATIVGKPHLTMLIVSDEES